jgi:hypothetical protein
MFDKQFFMHESVLYQGVEIDGSFHSFPTILLENQEAISGLLVALQILLDIYTRISSVKYLNVVVSIYILEVSDDSILIYPYCVERNIKDEFLEICKEDLFELFNFLTEEICDSK